ncbi:MAG: hypothetical protein WC804_05890 [Sphingomonas sp.]|uniref:hypothetical protein n=1 Tax=Sphingomonas sp. TaxID=28214 RepID=UPI00356A01D0
MTAPFFRLLAAAALLIAAAPAPPRAEPSAASASSSWEGTWHKVFIPDLNTNASGTVTPTGRDTMLVSGCLPFGLACKTQHWWRIG